MKKSIILAALSLIAVSATGCGGEKIDNRTQVVFWHTQGHDKNSILDKMIKEFEKDNPDIHIKDTQAASGYPELLSIIQQNISNGSLPTIAYCYPDHVAEYLSKNVVVNLDKYINDPELGFSKEDGYHEEDGSEKIGKEDYVEAFWKEGEQYASKGTYSVPLLKSTEVLFYNTDIFEEYGWEVPTTWDEMWALCKTIREHPDFAETPKDGDPKNYKYFPLGYDSDANFYITLSEQMGIPYTSAEGNEHYLFNNQKAKDMVAQLKEYRQKGYFMTKGTAANGTYTSTKFTNGEVLMSIGSTGGTTYNETYNFTPGVALPPQTDLNDPLVISQGPSLCMFNRASEAEQIAAWKFYKFITNTKNSARWSIQTGYSPVRQSSYESDAYERFITTGVGLLPKAAEVYSGMTNMYFNSPVFNGSTRARDQVGKMLAAVLNGQKDIDTAFSDAMSACVNG